MAISLKNIDDRLTVIENKKQSITTLFSTTTNFTGNKSFTLSQSVDNFDFIIIRINIWGSWRGRIDLCYPRTLITSSVGARYTDVYAEYPIREEGYEFKISGTVLTCNACYSDASSNTTSTNVNGTLYYVFGLKLYYNFSYNIIYKIYTKYKFQLLVILTHLRFKRRCKKYGY